MAYPPAKWRNQYHDLYHRCWCWGRLLAWCQLWQNHYHDGYRRCPFKHFFLPYMRPLVEAGHVYIAFHLFTKMSREVRKKKWPQLGLEELRKFGKGATLQHTRDLVRWWTNYGETAMNQKLVPTSVSQSKTSTRRTSCQCPYGWQVGNHVVSSWG